MMPLSVIVLDAGGHPIAFELSEGAAPGRFAIAQAEAYDAVVLGIGRQAQMARAEEQKYLMTAVNAVFGGKAVLPSSGVQVSGCVQVPGGVPVHDKKGRVISAVDVAGDSSEKDAAAASVGIGAAGLTGMA